MAVRQEAITAREVCALSDVAVIASLLLVMAKYYLSKVHKTTLASFFALAVDAGWKKQSIAKMFLVNAPGSK